MTTDPNLGPRPPIRSREALHFLELRGAFYCRAELLPAIASRALRHSAARVTACFWQAKGVVSRVPGLRVKNAGMRVWRRALRCSGDRRTVAVSFEMRSAARPISWTLAVIAVFTVLPGGAAARMPGVGAATPEGRIAYSTWQGRMYTATPRGEDVRFVSRGESPVLSPDGRWIAFERAQTIRVVRTDGSGARRLTTVRYDSHDLDAAWSPDGEWLAFRRARSVMAEFDEWVTSSSVHVVRRDGSGLRRVGKGPESFAPTWSADGSLIAFSYRGQLATVRPDGERLRVLRRRVGAGARFTLADVQFSPKGRRLAFTEGAPDGQWLRTLNLRTRRVLTIPPDLADEMKTFTWTPDGRRIAYLAERRTVQGGVERAAVGLYTVRPDGTDRRLVATGLQPRPNWYGGLSWAP